MDENANLPIPFGWYALAYSSELAAGDVQPLNFFDEHQVLFRTEEGAPQVLEAFCPHLGAHLGHGGKVHGEAIACPFHGWQFNGGGECVGVPYAKEIPKRAKGPAMPVQLSGAGVQPDGLGLVPSPAAAAAV